MMNEGNGSHPDFRSLLEALIEDWVLTRERAIQLLDTAMHKSAAEFGTRASALTPNERLGIRPAASLHS
jgi:hypothetical protein